MLTLAKPRLPSLVRPVARAVSSHRRNLVPSFRSLATVSPSLVTQIPPSDGSFHGDALRALDRTLLRSTPTTPLHELIQQYITESGTVLDVSLPYESRPPSTRRPDVTNVAESARNVITVAHCAQVGDAHKVTLASGFALNVDYTTPEKTKETLIVTCAHTLEEIRRSPLVQSTFSSPVPNSIQQSGTFIVTGSGASMQVFPVSRVVSSLPRSDLVLLSCEAPKGTFNTLPVSPYPAHPGTDIEAHFVLHDKPVDDGWSPWIADMWGKWHQGKVLGYRDFAGREAEPGTYDALSHLLFTPLPTAGSSGGPIIDKESGAVVGVMLGTRMDNHVEGVRGWGVPSETIFEMFTLPGLEGKK